MDNLRKLNTPEIGRLSGYLEALGNCMTSGDYVAWFEAKGFCSSSSVFVAEAVISRAYPESKPQQGEVIQRTQEEMIGTINKCLTLPELSYSDSGLRKAIERKLIRGFWKNLKACVDYEKATIIEYRPSHGSGDELWDFVYWGFTFVMYCQQERRCLIIHGGASD